MKKLLISILAIFLLGSAFIVYKLFIPSDSMGGFDITIRNKTQVDIEGLRITYDYITNDIVVPTIKAKEKYKTNIDPQEEFSESCMRMYYIDKLGIRQEETIIGYFEKGYSGTILIDINSIDINGKLIFDITERNY